MSAKKKETSRHAQRGLRKVRAYQAVFSGPEGTLVLHDLMAAHGMLRPSFDKDPYVTAFNEGERAVVIRILQFLQTDPSQLEMRLKEYVQELAE